MREAQHNPHGPSHVEFPVMSGDLILNPALGVWVPVAEEGLGEGSRRDIFWAHGGNLTPLYMNYSLNSLKGGYIGEYI